MKNRAIEAICNECSLPLKQGQAIIERVTGGVLERPLAVTIHAEHWLSAVDCTRCASPLSPGQEVVWIVEEGNPHPRIAPAHKKCPKKPKK